jgi:streptogramin lyase/plastocyanin
MKLNELAGRKLYLGIVLFAGLAVIGGVGQYLLFTPQISANGEIIFASSGESGSASEMPVGIEITDGKNITPSKIIGMSNKEPFYSPAEVSIEVGDTVKWLNSEKSDTHSIHERSGKFISPDVNPTTDWCYRFVREGIYTYTCRFHPWMKGKITVKAKTLEINETETGETGKVLGIAATQKKLWLVSDKGIRSVKDAVNTGKNSLDTANIHSFVFDGNNNFWTINKTENGLSKIETASRTISAVNLENQTTKPSAVALGKENELWLYDESNKSFKSFDRNTKKITVFKNAELKFAPAKMIADVRGVLWFIEQNRSIIGYFDPAKNIFKEFTLPASAELSALTVSPQGTAWATDKSRNKILKIENDWVIQYTIPTANSAPHDLAVDKFGNVWFTESAANKLGCLQTDGKFYEVANRTENETPSAITFDETGNLWFVMSKSNKLGMIGAQILEEFNTQISGLKEEMCSPSAPAVTAKP